VSTCKPGGTGDCVTCACLDLAKKTRASTTKNTKYEGLQTIRSFFVSFVCFVVDALAQASGIEQDGVLAQASLDFVTRVTGSKQGGYGFKTLTLVKVQGHWKIASEFYTAFSLPEA